MKLDLSGLWDVAFEESGSKLRYIDTIKLPSTTEQAGLGKESNDKTTLYLGRKRPVCGGVWYKRKFKIPTQWEDHYIRLILERSKFTKVWIDNKLIGESYETLIPQKYELGQIGPGEHEIVVRVDNDLTKYKCFPESLYNGHQYTEHTQTNWNGILGELYLESHKGIYIDKVFTHRLENELLIDILINQIERRVDEEPTISVCIFDLQTQRQMYESKQKLQSNEIKVSVLNELLKEWDEYNQSLYEIRINIQNENNEKLTEDFVVVTGRRFVEVQRHELRINHKRISLRGSLDCAIYPLTGACPFTVKEWEDILNKIKEFGMNHYRFHSWCPPKAAFIAADRLGMYLQVELSCFANALYQKEDEKYDEVIKQYLYDQSVKVLEEFGNHPSFVLFAIGNEMVGNLNAYNELLKYLKKVRTDILYSQGANNFLENPLPCEEDQFFVSMRTKPGKNIRASYSHNDLPLGSIQRKEILGTLPSYEQEAKEMTIPLIAHEIGQYQSFPLLRDRHKYIGPLRGDVYSVLEEKLKKKGLLLKEEDFYYASGALLVECYKAEIEANLRTKDMSGFQLLGLQDFTGQGTALIGLLDSFLENKGFIKAKDFRKFCNDTVVMATLSKYCFDFNEDIPFEIFIYNYSRENKKDTLSVELKVGEKVIASNNTENVVSENQRVSKVMEGILLPKGLDTAFEAKLHITYGEYENEYFIWLYPAIDTLVDERALSIKKKKNESNNIIEFEVYNEGNQHVWVTNTYNEKANQILNNNENVLLCTSKFDKCIEGFFSSDFWCYPMFEEACIKAGNSVAPGTMGLLIDTNHLAMKHFPTRKYSQWQWHQIVSNGVGVILDEETNYHIIVQVIDNFDRNHVLGLIYEKKTDKGKLLVCASDLLENLHIPEMKQLYSSLLKYILSTT